MKESFANAPVTTEELVSVFTMLTIETADPPRTLRGDAREDRQRSARDEHQARQAGSRAPTAISLATHLMATE